MRFWAVVATLLLLAPAAGADENSLGCVSELRTGFLLHDFYRNNTNKDSEKNSLDINLELLSEPLVRVTSESAFVQAILSPRAHLGAALNTAGYTHHAYTGFTWSYDAKSGLFTDASLGLSLHDGELHYKPGPVITGRPQLGSRVLFREAIEFGYRFESGYGLSLIGAHMSHAGLFADQNDGMTFVGLRISRKFGR